MSNTDRLPVSTRTLGTLVAQVGQLHGLFIEFQGDVSERLAALEILTKTAGLNGAGDAIRRIAAAAPALERVASKADILDRIADERERREIHDAVEADRRKQRGEREAEQAERAARNPIVRLWRLVGAHAITGIAGAAAGAIAAHLLPRS